MPSVDILARPRCRPAGDHGRSRASRRASGVHLLAANQPLKGGDPCFLFLKQLGGLGVVIKGPGLVLADPDPDQGPRHVVALGKSVKGLAADEFLRHLALEPDAVRAVSGHWLSYFESLAHGSILRSRPV